MNKQKITDAIIQAQANVELCRRSLNRIGNYQDSEYKRIYSMFETDLAYRNGLIHALLLSDECDKSDMEYLQSLPNRPSFIADLFSNKD